MSDKQFDRPGVLAFRSAGISDFALKSNIFNILKLAMQIFYRLLNNEDFENIELKGYFSNAGRIGLTVEGRVDGIKP